jgi:RecJ-like exonuclease
MKETIEFLESLCDELNERDLLKQVFQANGYLCATDAHILIRIKPDKSFDLSAFNDFSDKVKVHFFEKNCNHVIGLNSLREAISKIPIKDVREKIECPECDGYGTVEWEYKENSKEFDCPKCDGHGDILSGKIFKDTKQYTDCYIKIKDGFFNGRYIEKLIQTCEIERIESVELVKTASDKNSLFVAGRFDFVIMPVLREHDDNFTEVTIN